MSMKKQIAKRIAELIIILIVLSFLTFLLMYLAPGDPAEKRLSSQGVAVTKEVLQAEQERMGLLRPFTAPPVYGALWRMAGRNSAWRLGNII